MTDSNLCFSVSVVKRLAKLVLLIAGATMAGSALAIGEATCGTVSPSVTFSAGAHFTTQPHHLQTSRSYGQSGCASAYVWSMTYDPSSGAPGLYVSYADSVPTTQSSCSRAKVRAYVYKKNGSASEYLGNKVLSGTWVPSPHVGKNSDRTHVCRTPVIRLQDYFSLQTGSTYQVAVRAELKNATGSGYSRRLFAVAEAPFPSNGGGVAQTGSDHFVALPSSGNASVHGQRIPDDAFHFSLLENARVGRAGDLLFATSTIVRYDEFFLSPYESFHYDGNNNTALSNASVLPSASGATTNLAGVSCPDYTIVDKLGPFPVHSYDTMVRTDSNPSTTYIDAWHERNASYCALTAESTDIYALSLLRPDKNMIIVKYRWKKSTGRKSYGCLSGFCNDDVTLAVRDGANTANDADVFMPRVFELDNLAKKCVDDYLGKPLPISRDIALHATLGFEAYAEQATVSQFGSTNFGYGSLISFGFVGVQESGTTRTGYDGLRFENHETFHAVNNYLFEDSLPSWLTEGLSIHQESHNYCDGHPDFLTVDRWRMHPLDTLDPARADSSGHSHGETLFYQLEDLYDCDTLCVRELWLELVNQKGNDTDLNNTELKQVFEGFIGADLDAVFTRAGIPFERDWIWPSPPDSTVPCGRLPEGFGLAPGQALVSCNGRYSARMNSLPGFSISRDGELIAVLEFGAERDDSRDVSGIINQGDGYLNVFDSHGAWIWGLDQSVAGNAGAYLELGNDGGIRFKRANGSVLWNTLHQGTLPGCGRLQPDMVLGYGVPLLSCDGKTQVRLTHSSEPGQTNAIVIETSKGHPNHAEVLWKRELDRAPYQAFMQTDGNFVVRDINGGAIWATNTAGSGGDMIQIQGDSNFVIYDQDASPDASVWASNTVRN